MSGPRIPRILRIPHIPHIPHTMRAIRDLAGQTMVPNLRALVASRQPLVWLLAVLVGIGVAYAILVFRSSIAVVQYLWLGTMVERVSSWAANKPAWLIVLAPAAGGLAVGLFLHHVMPGRRAEGVADVIEARALNRARMPFWPGIGNAFVAAVSLGAGASAGREGPAVHLGAVLASGLGRWFALPPTAARALLGCGVAAAVSASFNAPIAGALFALEVVLGHYALSAFIPIVIATVGATVVTRIHLGDFPAFTIHDAAITSPLEFPAFALLGVVCGLVAVSFQFFVAMADTTARRVSMPLWLRPVAGGLMIGAMGVYFPQVLGVGYEATDSAIKGLFPLSLMLALIAAKMIATAITLASRFGGGVFSPSLYLGCMTGGAFGVMAGVLYPDFASSSGVYAIIGMGAVAAAVLGAPISTTLIVFEMTGGYELTIALLLAISASCALMQAVYGRSLFHWQLETRGLFLSEGAHRQITRTMTVSDFMSEFDADERPRPAKGDTVLLISDTMETALRAFDRTGRSRLLVRANKTSRKMLGWAERVRALDAYNAALIDANIEEHK